MQAPTTRLPTNFVRLAVALLAAALLGVTLGFTLKPPTTVVSPNRPVVIQTNDYSCEFVDHHKAC